MYKATWSPQVGEKLKCNEDTRQEAKDYDEHAVGLFELSSVIDHFLKADKLNSVCAEVTGKRKRDVGLVVSAIFSVIYAYTLHIHFKQEICTSHGC